MSRETLGEMLGVSGRTVSYWETWRKIPSDSRIDAIRKILGLSDTDIWRATHRASIKIPKRARGSIWMR